MELDDKIWSRVNGAHKMPYNAARPLRKLKDASVREEYEAIFKELWEHLLHHDSVGVASYLAVPQLVSICIDKKSFDWNFIGLCIAIENRRIEDHNPDLPMEYQDLYFEALGKLEKYLLLNFKNISDQQSLRMTLALLATANGQPELGKVIEDFAGKVMDL